MKGRVSFWTTMVVGLLVWPIEALSAMWGCDLLEHEGFAVPTPGYWSCFVVALALGLLWCAATLSTRVNESTS